VIVIIYPCYKPYITLTFRNKSFVIITKKCIIYLAFICVSFDHQFGTDRSKTVKNMYN